MFYLIFYVRMLYSLYINILYPRHHFVSSLQDSIGIRMFLEVFAVSIKMEDLKVEVQDCNIE